MAWSEESENPIFASYGSVLLSDALKLLLLVFNAGDMGIITDSLIGRHDGSLPET